MSRISNVKQIAPLHRNKNNKNNNKAECKQFSQQYYISALDSLAAWPRRWASVT